MDASQVTNCCYLKKKSRSTLDSRNIAPVPKLLAISMYATNQTEYLPTMRLLVKRNTDKSSVKRNRTQGILHNIRTPNQTRLAMTSEGLEGLRDVIHNEKRRKKENHKTLETMALISSWSFNFRGMKTICNSST
ncbi:uncharacterized protein ANIA_10244 [Aspergillus nidulans FGSC A4]|uniref:Uncharacterized protein n=1 Tax=Emericella nidulans (strain FGSC A4 / ATCC 38163 / CBS 112.46 / NRRL 194 / M139) TaxID=227321 RepID=C8VPR7_EMENI|nr:hypothetical protein [Aspergillus nidulans FGSC A4]CBF85692.1 TPA: hypothetical protein ANIA_10244 [Aspergillus nidulans FGSC A4]